MKRLGMIVVGFLISSSTVAIQTTDIMFDFKEDYCVNGYCCMDDDRLEVYYPTLNSFRAPVLQRAKRICYRDMREEAGK